MKVYSKAKIHMFMVALVFIGAIHYVLIKFNYDPLVMLNNYIMTSINYDLNIDQVFVLLIAISVIYLSMQRDTWLPFLGETVLPSTLIPLKKLEGNRTVEIKVKPNTKIAYWSALPSKEIPDVVTAYGDFSQSGVVMSDENGIATLTFNDNEGYVVPTGKYIKPHLHYRELTGEYGMISPIKTQYYENE
jgi:hypothetical protein